MVSWKTGHAHQPGLINGPHVPRVSVTTDIYNIKVMQQH